MKKINIFSILRTVLIVLFGNAMYAFAVTFLIVPNGLILGGFTGLSITINHFVNVKVSLLVLICHLTVFLIGAVILGYHFAISTIASTFLYPVFLNLSEILYEKFPFSVTDLLPVNALLSALFIGISLGVLTTNGTSTGGTEVIPLVINKLTGRSVGFILFILDGIIMVVQLVYSDVSKILYGIAIVAVYSVIVHCICNIGRAKEADGNGQ